MAFTDQAVSYLQDIWARILGQPASIPIALVAGSLAIVKYLVLPFYIEQKYHARVLVGILVVDGALLGISYVTGLLAFPFGINIPTLSFSGLNIGQSQLALVIGIGGLAAYSSVVLFHQSISLDFLSRRLTSPPQIPTISQRQFGVLGIVVALALGLSAYFLGFLSGFSTPTVSYVTGFAGAVQLQDPYLLGEIGIGSVVIGIQVVWFVKVWREN